MKKWNLLPATVFVWAAWATPVTTLAKSGVESVNLDYVALDASSDCNRILFQSSQHFRGTVFAIPRVVGASNLEDTVLYDIKPASQPGLYNLTVNLYFPTNDEVLQKGAASTYKIDTAACNWDKVKYDLNRRIADPSARVQQISNIPLTSVEVRLTGIQRVGLIGRNVESDEESDILDYSGKVLSVRFLNISEEEKNAFQSQLVGPTGISAMVKFRFQARSRNGSVTARINTANLAQNFSMAAQANGFKYLGSAELQATLKTSMTENSVQIINEAGTSGDMSAIANTLLDRMMKDINMALPNVTITEADKAKAGSGKISVAALAEIIKTKVQSEISFSNFSAPESASAQTEIRLKADRSNDPNTVEKKVIAGYGAPSFEDVLNAGESIMISPASWYFEKIEYKEFKRYLTMSDFETLNIAGEFASISDQKVKIENVIVNDFPIAQGTNSWQRGGGFFRWVRTQRIAVRTRTESMNYLPTAAELEKVPVSLTFSALGDTRSVRLSEFQSIGPNPFWSAIYDEMTGRLIITAKQNLGSIRIRGRLNGNENIQYSAQPIVLDQVSELYTNPLPAPFSASYTYGQPVVLKQDPKAIIGQKTIVLRITHPRKLKPEELQNIERNSKAISKIPLKPTT